jgi:hypothetical protein
MVRFNVYVKIALTAVWLAISVLLTVLLWVRPSVESSPVPSRSLLAVCALMLFCTLVVERTKPCLHISSMSLQVDCEIYIYIYIHLFCSPLTTLSLSLSLSLPTNPTARLQEGLRKIVHSRYMLHPRCHGFNQQLLIWIRCSPATPSPRLQRAKQRRKQDRLPSLYFRLHHIVRPSPQTFYHVCQRHFHPTLGASETAESFIPLITHSVHKSTHPSLSCFFYFWLLHDVVLFLRAKTNRSIGGFVL